MERRKSMTTQNYWAFPKEIPLEEVPRYSSIFEKITEPKTIQFDLTKTEWIHSSFIGFLIYAKHLTTSKGGKLYIIPSPAVQHILDLMNLREYLLH
jgi:anti-anti-sigma regulatory factor